MIFDITPREKRILALLVFLAALCLLIGLLSPEI